MNKCPGPGYTGSVKKGTHLPYPNLWLARHVIFNPSFAQLKAWKCDLRNKSSIWDERARKVRKSRNVRFGLKYPLKIQHANLNLVLYSCLALNMNYLMPFKGQISFQQLSWKQTRVFMCTALPWQSGLKAEWCFSMLHSSACTEVQLNTIKFSAVQWRTVKDIKVQFGTVQYSAVNCTSFTAPKWGRWHAWQHSAVHCTVHYLTVQCSSAVMYIAVQYWTVLYSALLHLLCTTVQ